MSESHTDVVDHSSAAESHARVAHAVTKSPIPIVGTGQIMS